jgi:hypothetical protein
MRRKITLRDIRKHGYVAWSEHAAIADLRKLAKWLQLEIDHIVPITGKYVCGLHVIDNIQLITKEQNRAKSNHFCDEDHTIHSWKCYDLYMRKMMCETE